MKHYKNENNQVFAYDDDFKNVPETYTPLSDLEIEKHLNPEISEREFTMVEIYRLEALETPRRIAEAVLNDEGRAWLQSNRDLITIERGKL